MANSIFFLNQQVMFWMQKNFKKYQDFSCTISKGRLYISSLNGMDQLRAARTGKVKAK